MGQTAIKNLNGFTVFAITTWLLASLFSPYAAFLIMCSMVVMGGLLVIDEVRVKRYKRKPFIRCMPDEGFL